MLSLFLELYDSIALLCTQLLEEMVVQSTLVKIWRKESKNNKTMSVASLFYGISFGELIIKAHK